jgi:hypothetical protein
VDQSWLYYLDGCPDCGHKLQSREGRPRVLQQIELLELPISIEEHESHPQWCPQCQRVHYAPFPEDLKKAGLVGPRLTAFIGFMKGACHMSFSTMRKFLRNVVGVTLSRGQLRKLVGKVSDSLGNIYDELLRLLPEEPVLNVDETGHKDNGSRMWTWCFRAATYTLFKISPSRGSDVLLKVLGEEFQGVLGCDYFSAYRKYMRLADNVTLQFCLAHLIRDVKFLVDHPNPKNRAYGERVLAQLRALFHTIHRRHEYASPETFEAALKRIRYQFMCETVVRSPHTREAMNLAQRFQDHCDSYFRFISEPNIEPTNNLAEQAVRFVAIHRRLTQGTRSESGQTWCERIWTAAVTCEQQGRSLFKLLCDSVSAYFTGQKPPTLAILAPD